VALVVQKFGGTSVADSDKILAAARRAIRAHREGNAVIVVVSARGKTTDELIGLAKEITERPPAREMDMLLSTGEQVSVALMAMAIQAGGVPAISFTGAQIGIVTDSFHTKARIRNISTDRVNAALGEGKIVIVAGFQGVDEHYNITTLGRGGSDTSAVALAAVLGAEVCEIYTDVDGVYTTDPRIVVEARKIDKISYDEMLELASLGAGVMHSRSIEFAKKFHVPIHVRSSFSDVPGTWIVDEAEARTIGSSITGAALAKDEARVTLLGVPNRPGVVHAVFRRIAEANLVVDMIVQNVATDGRTELSFTVGNAELADTLRVAEHAAEEIGAEGITHDPEVAKVSAVGLGMRVHPGVAHAMFQAIADAGVNIQMITTSEIKISALVDRNSAANALRAVHQAFELHRARLDDRPLYEPPTRGAHAADEASIASEVNAGFGASEAGMEDVVVSDVELDEQQARVTILNVPDRPGYAALVFGKVAEAEINVDMIVQNIRSASGDTRLSLTVPRREVERASAIAADVAGGRDKLLVDPTMAKLSVIGIGMRTHTGVANRMFGALAEAGINIELISTSEVRVNVLTELERGQEALERLRNVFATGGAPTRPRRP